MDERSVSGPVSCHSARTLLTSGSYISNVHRVTHTSDADRYTIVFNYNGNPDYVIKCIESCRAQGETEKYAPIKVEDYIKRKYQDVYARAGVYQVAGAA